MSSFIHTGCHFNSVERAIQYALVSREEFFTYRLKRKLPLLDDNHYGIDRVYEQTTRYMDCIRKLSVLCVSLQYKHHYEGTLDREIEVQTEILMRDKSESKVLNKVGLYKALQSMGYQIEVEHLRGLRELTQEEEEALQMIQILEDDLAHEIVHGLSEYDNAEWSL